MRSPPDFLTYKYPRTELEAFGPDADSANALQRFPSRREKRRPVLNALLITTAAICLAYLIGAV